MQKHSVEGANQSHDVVEAGANVNETVTCEENVTSELQQVMNSLIIICRISCFNVILYECILCAVCCVVLDCHNRIDLCSFIFSCHHRLIGFWDVESKVVEQTLQVTSL